jgi:phosphoglycolate phosphatase
MNMQADVRFIVFDWDGTLMDSEAQIVSCLHAAIADLRLDPMDDDTVKNVIGLGLREAVDTLVPGRDAAFQQSFVGLQRVLDETGLVDCFDATRCADETLSKPHPQMLLELMEELDISPEQTIMVGDTEYDMEMATNAGAGKVAVSSGVHTEARLNRHAPLVCLERVADMPAWMAGAGIIPG